MDMPGMSNLPGSGGMSGVSLRLSLGEVDVASYDGRGQMINSTENSGRGREHGSTTALSVKGRSTGLRWNAFSFFPSGFLESVPMSQWSMPLSDSFEEALEDREDVTKFSFTPHTEVVAMHTFVVDENPFIAAATVRLPSSFALRL